MFDNLDKLQEFMNNSKDMPPLPVPDPKGKELINELKEKIKDKPTSSGALELTNCPHCGWKLDRADPEDPSDVDKANFVQSILGQIPFKKAYSLLNDKLVVEFRTLTSEESDLVFTQASYDAQQLQISDEGKYFRTIADYRLCLGLACIKFQDKTTRFPESLDDWKLDAPKDRNTKLKPLTIKLYSSELKLESLRRAISTQFFRFQRLVEKLEAHVDSPDFW